MILNFFLPLQLVRNLSISDYGDYELYIRTIEICVIISMVGLKTLTMKETSINLGLNNEIKALRILNSNVKIVFINSILIGFIAIIFKFLNIIEIKYSLLYILILILIFRSISTIKASFINGMKKFFISQFYLEIFGITLIYLTLITSVNLKLKISLNNILISLMAGRFLSLIFTTKYINNFFKLYFLKKIRKREISLKESFPILITTLTAILIINSNIFILKYYFDSEIVGKIAFNFRVLNLIMFANLIATTILSPQIALLWKKNKIAELQNKVSAFARILVFSSTVIVFIIYLFLNHILNFFGKELIIDQTSFIIFLIAGFIGSVSGGTGIIMTMTGDQRKLSSINIIGFIITIILGIILIKSFGPMGVALNYLISVLITEILKYLFVLKFKKINTLKLV